MDQVTHRLPPGFVWPTVGHPGSVPLWALVPTPKQPRQHIDDDELRTLADTMKPENGGQQREILAVRCLTGDELSECAPARYMIKSGERRWRAAHLAGLETVEIRVKQYASLAEEKLDTHMLNEGRVGLSDIENADSIADIMQEFGLQTQAELARKIGKDEPWVQQHLSLLKLSSSARELMSPKLPQNERLKRRVGVFLSKLSPETQDQLVKDMPKGSRVTGGQQLIWLQCQLKGTSEAVEPVRHNSYLMRRVIGYFADQVERRARELLAMKDFERLFSNASEAQVLELVGRIKDAQAELGDLVAKIEQYSIRAIPDKPHKSVIEAPPPPPPVTVKPPVFTPAHKTFGRVSLAPPAPVHSGAMTPRVAQAPLMGRTDKQKTVSYEDTNVGRKVTGKVSQEKYLELYDRGLLGFQVDNKERPTWMPTREAAVEDWAKFCD